MRLIDADKMRENLEWCKIQATTDNFWDDAIERLDVQPTVEAVPLKPLAKFIVDNLDPRVDCGTCAKIADGWEERVCSNCPEMNKEQVMDRLKKWMKETNAQTVEAVPVVHGRWVNMKSGDADCSVCGRHVKGVYDDDNADRFCRCCGAKMDGGDRRMTCTCETCKWRSDDFTSACVNEDSEHRADFVNADDTCECWEGNDNGNKTDPV